MRILLVEDDDRLCAVLVPELLENQYTVDVARHPRQALTLLANASYDLLLLDVVLPDLDGISFCRQLRERGLEIPILLLTARNKSTDKVEGLDAGADDYLIKPFNLEELLARMRALRRRSAVPNTETIEVGPLCLHLHSSEVSYNDRMLPITQTEYSILELLLRNPNQTVTQTQLIEHVWKFKEVPGGTTLRSHIKSLRKKFKGVGLSPELIKTIYGVGYRLEKFEAEEVPPKSTSKGQKTSTRNLQPPTRKQKTLAALRQSWQKFRKSILADIDRIEAVVNGRGKLSSAIETAHKLVGLLGSLRLLEGARLAGEIENLLLSETRIEPDLPILTVEMWSEQVQERLAMLRQVLENPESQWEESTNDLAREQVSATSKPPLVAIVDDDRQLAEQLRQSSIARGLQASVANSISEGKALIESHPPDIAILDLCFPEDMEDGFELLAQLREHQPQIPTVVLTVRGDLYDRDRVADSQAVAFVRKPCPPERVLQIVEQALISPSSPSAKISIVDDDPNFLALFRSSFASEELTISTLGEPQRFWEHLETIEPNLLVLDLSMPDFDGFQLAQVVRNDPKWQNLPIICLSAYCDPENLQRAFAVGADDCLHKSISHQELRSRIFGHLQRVRRLTQRAV